MNMHRFKTIALAVTMSFAALLGSQTQANTVDAVLNVSQTKTVAAQQSQQAVDKLAEETGNLLQDYKTVMKQVDGLRVYNARLEKQIANQQQRIQDIETSIDQVTVIQRQVTPLVIRMIDSLEQFVKLDIPFLMEERTQRIAFLRNNVDRSDLSVAEKFRQVLEAYKIENEFGRKVTAYKGSLPIEGVDRDVNFFQVGRVALLYQTTDTEVSGAWDKAAGEFVQLDKGEYRNAILKGLRVARKEASIEILKLPISAPEAVQ
jgi:multidrug efflux pump subunit AcrA (membrane-fusion protein)